MTDHAAGLTVGLAELVRGLSSAAVVADQNKRPLVWNDAYSRMTSANGGGLGALVAAIPVRDAHGAAVATLEIYRDAERETLSALGTFVAGIAHELNNPINFVSGNIDLVEDHVRGMRSFWRRVFDEVLDVDQRTRVNAMAEQHGLSADDRDLDESMAGIAAGAERAARIIRDVRAVILGGSSERTDVCIADAVQAASGIARAEMGVHIVVTENLDPSCTALANQSQIVQVVLNLLQNARDAIGMKPGFIEVTVAHRDNGVIIEVADDGEGISNVEQLRIFEPFYTTKGSTGMGLGLALSRSIVEGHGGRLTVQSEVGAGAQFTVWLPSPAA